MSLDFGYIERFQDKSLKNKLEATINQHKERDNNKSRVKEIQENT